jgi:ABC-type amino acid transport substrate-binding protein
VAGRPRRNGRAQTGPHAGRPEPHLLLRRQGTQRGLSYDAGRAFEDELNQKLGKKAMRVDVVFVPVSRDEILLALIQGRGDIAAANLTITPERKQWVDFSAPLWTGVDEVVVTGPASPPLRGIDDLAGQEAACRARTSRASGT